MTDARTVDTVVECHNFGTPTARKVGRRKEWPHCPIVNHGSHTEQIRGFAYATHAEAVQKARDTIEYRRRLFRDQLNTPRYRALRIQHGLPENFDGGGRL